MPPAPCLTLQFDCNAGSLEVCFATAGSPGHSVKRASVYASCRAPTTCSLPRLAGLKEWAAAPGTSTTVSVGANEGGWDTRCYCPGGATPYLIVEAGVGLP
jgi:hypothetical protein